MKGITIIDHSHVSTKTREFIFIIICTMQKQTISEVSPSGTYTPKGRFSPSKIWKINPLLPAASSAVRGTGML